jgi:hypothetical protein
VETDVFTPNNKHFTPIFNKVGGDVWNKWDNFLQQQTGDGMEEISILIK